MLPSHGIANPSYILIGSEVLKVTGIAVPPTLTVERGADGTDAATIADDAKVFLLADPLRQIDAYDGRAPPYSYIIRARAVPKPPLVSLAQNAGRSTSARLGRVRFGGPLSVTDGLEGPESFTAASLMVSWENGGRRGAPVDKYRVEWAMDDRFTKDYQTVVVANNRTSVNTIDGSQEAVKGAPYPHSSNLEQWWNLTCANGADCRGQRVYVRLSAHNSLGYSDVTETFEATPMTSADPPIAPSLEALDGNDHTVQDVGSQLLVRWAPPRNDSVDLYGDGGDRVTSYLVEYSKIPWSAYAPVVQRVRVRKPGENAGSLDGTIRLSLNTTNDKRAVVKTFATSARIFVGNATAYDVKTILENMPNVGEVDVSIPDIGDASSVNYDITFVDVIGNMSMLEPFDEGLTYHSTSTDPTRSSSSAAAAPRARRTSCTST